jgi:transposase-like protein
MPACPHSSSSDLTRDGHDQRRRTVRACRACGRYATSESTSLIAGHRLPRNIILLAVRYYLQLGAAAECIADILADRGVDVSGRTILRCRPWVRRELADAAMSALTTSPPSPRAWARPWRTAETRRMGRASAAIPGPHANVGEPSVRLR